MVFADPSAHRGAGYVLTGPRAVGFLEVAAILTSELGEPVIYYPASAPAYLRYLCRQGLPVAQALVQPVLHTGCGAGTPRRSTPPSGSCWAARRTPSSSTSTTTATFGHRHTGRRRESVRGFPGQHRSAGAALPCCGDLCDLGPAEATHRHRVVRDVITCGIHRGALPQGTDADDVLDLLTGPVFYRRWVSTGAVDQQFTTRVIDVVLAGYQARRT